MIRLQQFSLEAFEPDFHHRDGSIVIHILGDKNGHKLQKYKEKPKPDAKIYWY